MKALRKLGIGPGSVELIDLPQPRPAPGTVLVAVTATGVCGTDLHIVAGEYPTAVPVTMGHEISGMVREVGANVDRSWVGQRVVCETFFSTCENCTWCRLGQTNLCPNRQSLGTHCDGGFADAVVVPAVNLHAIPSWLDAYAAALIEPLACVCHALLNVPLINSGQRILVTGPGPVGILAGQVARSLGADVTIMGLPQDQSRLDIAATLGLDTVISPDPASEVDVVVECSGSGGAAQVGLAAVARGGRYVQVGVFGSPVTVDLNQIVFKEVTVSSGFASTRDSWRQALTFVTDRQVHLEPLISDVFALNAWETAFDQCQTAAGLKIILDPQLDG